MGLTLGNLESESRVAQSKIDAVESGLPKEEKRRGRRLVKAISTETYRQALTENVAYREAHERKFAIEFILSSHEVEQAGHVVHFWQPREALITFLDHIVGSRWATHVTNERVLNLFYPFFAALAFAIGVARIALKLPEQNRVGL